MIQPQKFVLNVKPFSINNVHYRDGKRKTTECKNWEMSVFNALDTPEHINAMELLHSNFDASRHGFHIELTCFYPQEQFKAKAGNISSKTQDITNWEKPLVDLLFLDKYSFSQAPFGIQNIRIDDKFIVSMLSQKKSWAADRTKIEIQIGIVEV